MTQEVLTFQFGNYSNYIGAHFWNIQQNQFVYPDELERRKDIPDVNHDVLFREGISNRNRLIYTPRAILMDMKDNVNVLKTSHEPREDDQSTDKINWSGKVQVVKREADAESEYATDLEAKRVELESGQKRKLPIGGDGPDPTKKSYAMNEQVKYWTDYIALKYHERSYQLTSQYQNSTPESEPLDLFNYGANLFDSKTFYDDFEEKLRHFGEECDNIQGFQMFVDPYNGFGGAAVRSLDLVAEEYAKRPVLSFFSFPHHDEQDRAASTKKLLNTALTLKSLLADHNDMVVVPLSLNSSFYMSKVTQPIKLPSIDYDPSLAYHTSAILASLVDAATLPYRQKSQRSYMSDIVRMFDCHKHKVACMQAVFPLEIDANSYLFNYLQNQDLFETASWFTPMCSSTKCASSLVTGATSVCCRGIAESRVKNIKDTYVYKGSVSAHVVFDRYFEDMYPKTQSKSFSIDAPLNVDMPYPNIFAKYASTYGNIYKKASKTASLITMMQSNQMAFGLIDHIAKSVASVDLSKQFKYLENGMELDDFDQLTQFNRDLSEIYAI